jgi:Popeye protein conserved region
MEIWFHLANVIYVFSYLVTDILWLRALAVVGGFSYLTWTLTTPAPSRSLIGWTLVYNTINVVQIVRLWLERRPLRLGADEQALYAATFRTLTPREFRRLLAAAQWRDAKPGEVLIAEGTLPGRVLVLAAGRAVVRSGGRDRATLGPGQFAGEMSFLTGAPTSASVEVVEAVRFVSWSTAELERCLGRHPALRAALQLVMGRDLAAKLREGRTWDAAPTS